VDESQFWAIIEAARNEAHGDVEYQATLVVAKLTALPVEEICAFQHVLDSVMDRAYDHDLWGAAYLLNGGCSDDGFDYFRGWLIAQGRAVYEDALREPQSLRHVTGPGVSCEDFLYVALDAYEAKTGQQMPLRQRTAPELKGRCWDDDELPFLYPKLWAAVAFYWGYRPRADRLTERREASQNQPSDETS
jgi:hypothetical protein